MGKEKRGKKMNNRLLYTFITLGIMVLVLAGVYAYNSGADPSTFGHSASEIDFSEAIDGQLNINGPIAVNPNSNRVLEIKRNNIQEKAKPDWETDENRVAMSAYNWPALTINSYWKYDSNGRGGHYQDFKKVIIGGPVTILGAQNGVLDGGERGESLLHVNKIKSQEYCDENGDNCFTASDITNLKLGIDVDNSRRREI
jgi:hypothetical protein